MNFEHTQETPASIIGVVPFGAYPNVVYLTASFLLTFAFVKGGDIPTYNNDSSSGDVTNELTFEKKPKRCIRW
jgi:hypothetical protein